MSKYPDNIGRASNSIQRGSLFYRNADIQAQAVLPAPPLIAVLFPNKL